MSSSEYEERARAAKAFRLVKVCEKMGWPANDVALFQDGTWSKLAEVAGVKPPSDRTKAIVLHILRERTNG